MATIFVSYRRTDSQDVTGRIYDRLVAKYSSDQVYKDVDSIPLGVSFPAHIRQLLHRADLVLVIIGPTWLNCVNDSGQRRLDDPNDYVRLEVELALRRKMPVIPVLLSNTRMPQESELPPSMRGLASRNGIPVRSDPDFNNDMARLFGGLGRLEPHLAKIAKPGGRQKGQLLVGPQPQTNSRRISRLMISSALVASIVVVVITGFSWFYFNSVAEVEPK